MPFRLARLGREQRGLRRVVSSRTATLPPTLDNATPGERPYGRRLGEQSSAPEPQEWGVP